MPRASRWHVSRQDLHNSLEGFKVQETVAGIENVESTRDKFRQIKSEGTWVPIKRFCVCKGVFLEHLKEVKIDH